MADLGSPEHYAGRRTADAAESKDQLEAMEKALASAAEREAQAEKRLQTYRSMLDQLDAMIDSGKLSVRIVRNRMVVELPEAVLFSSGSARIKWKARYEELGEEGLCDRSRAPRHSPRSTPANVVRKILYLRQRYHFGPGRISGYLQRYHEISIAASSVHRILCKHGVNRLPANQKHRPHRQRWKRYEKRQPGHRLQVDVKFLERIPGTRKRFYQFTAIDDCTRIRVLKIYDACNQKTAIQFIDEVIRRLPFRVHVVQTDNGAEFQSKFRWHLQDRDVRHVYIRPRTPRLNGKVERSHRIDDEEFYQVLEDSAVRESIHLFNKKLREWEDYYNFDRPHGALDGQTPYERLLEKTRAEVSPLS